MLQSISKKNKIIIYLILLFILSTTSGKFHITQNNYLSTDTKISVVGLSNIENFNISNELSNFFNKNLPAKVFLSIDGGLYRETSMIYQMVVNLTDLKMKLSLFQNYIQIKHFKTK